MLYTAYIMVASVLQGTTLEVGGSHMAAKKTPKEKTGIHVWVEEETLGRLDAYLQHLVRDTPGAKISRSSYLAHLLRADLDAKLKTTLGGS